MSLQNREQSVPNFKQLHHGEPHDVARTQVAATLLKAAAADRGITTIQRLPVSVDQANWHSRYPNYTPPVVDMPRGTTSFRKPDDFPDPADPQIIDTFNSLEVTDVERYNTGAPRNPIGRTGLQGRGILNKWGPNQAADPIVTRNNPQSGQLEALLIQRSDCGEWALPGGKVDAGETAQTTAARELGEEAGVQGIQLDFTTARPVYAGYVDDPRNTDNAWMETTGLHLHLTPRQAELVQVEAGSDAAAVQWKTITRQLLRTMYAGQGEYLGLAIQYIPER